MWPARAPAALLVVLLLALGTLAGASARTSREGGTLVIGLGGVASNVLDPTRSTAGSALTIYRSFCEKLYDLDANGEVVPQLASAMPVVSRDKLTYTVPLRRGIVFNDGTPFNANAVVASIERYKTDPQSSRASDLEPVDSVTARDPNTVVLHLKAPFAVLVGNLATAAGAVLSPAQLAKLGDNFGSNPICVGPFMFDSTVAGDSVTVVRSPYYYDRARVHLDRIVFKYLSGPSAAAALRAGDLQVFDTVSPSDLATVARTGGLRIVGQKSFGYYAVYFNIGNRNGVEKLPYRSVDTPWATTPKLRQAFEEAIDRKTLATVVFGGRVQPGCTPVSPISTWFQAVDVSCTPYDPADARKLVAASGVHSPTLHLTTRLGNLDDSRLAQFIQAEEDQVGITVVIEPNDGNALNDGRYESGLNAWAGGGGGDPDRNLYSHLATDGSRNYSGYSNPRLDLILENARKASTDKARQTLYRAAQRIVLADRPIVYLYHAIRYAGIDTRRVTGVDFFADGQVRANFAQLK